MKEAIRTLTMPDRAGIAYRVVREGPVKRALVLLHGMASNMTRWSEFMDQTSLRNSWDLIALDLRGNGRSIVRSPITRELWTDDIAAILDHEGYSQAVIVGHCLGANTAIQFAERYPGKTAGLILIEPLFPRSFAGALKKVRAMRLLLLPITFAVRFLNRLGVHRRRFPLLDLRELDRETRAAVAAQGPSEAIDKRYASVTFDLRFMPAAAYLYSLRELLRPLPALADIRVPLLLLFSTGKVFSDPAIAQQLCPQLPNCKTLVLDSHHWIPTERPAEMREAIEAWCRETFSTSKR